MPEIPETPAAGPIVGIDLGTTNSLVGAMDAGFPVLIAGADGQRLTPSVVYFPPQGEFGHAEVGRNALPWRVVRPERTISSIKRLMGRRVGEVDTPDLSSAIGGAKGSPIRLRIDAGELSPEEISAWILRKLKADAEAALGVPVCRAVITVPAYFNDAQRNSTKKAGELAGLHVERILNEPTAAALAYGLDRLGEKSKIAVYDLGGGTFDISILELNAGVFEVLSTNGNTRLGGDDIDTAFFGLLAEKILTVLAHDNLPWSGRERLLNAAPQLAVSPEVIKRSLSTHATAEIILPFMGLPERNFGQVTRAELESVARPVVERTRAHCLRALADAKISPGELDAVILVGGATRMPLVRELVASVFGREPDTSQNPDEAVAIGATIQAGILSGAVRDVVLLDVTPLSLGIETFGGLANVIIPRNTTIPVKAGEMFTNPMAGQSVIGIHVIQGERERAADNWTLGRFELDFLPGPRGSARVGVQFEIDADGILQVLARDTKTGREKIVAIESAVDVSDAQVETMIAESVEHAFDDYHARLLVEARQKAAEMLPAVKNALELAGDLLPANERARIAALGAEVEAATIGEDASALKAALAALDAGTQDLATLLVEQAMDEALARRGIA